MKTIITAIVIAIFAAADLISAEISIKGGKKFSNAKIAKLQKQNVVYFKIINSEGSKLIKPADLEPLRIALKDGTVYDNVKVMDIMKDGISIYTDQTMLMLKFDELTPESLAIFDLGQEEKPKAPPEPTKPKELILRHRIASETSRC